MRHAGLLILASCFVGCAAWFMAQSPVWEAQGTWKGSLSPLKIRVGGSEMVAALLKVESGPPLHDRDRPSSTIATAGRHVVLADRSWRPLPWSDDLPRRAVVQGTLRNGREKYEVWGNPDGKSRRLPMLNAFRIGADD